MRLDHHVAEQRPGLFAPVGEFVDLDLAFFEVRFSQVAANLVVTDFLYLHIFLLFVRMRRHKTSCAFPDYSSERLMFCLRNQFLTIKGSTGQLMRFHLKKQVIFLLKVYNKSENL